MDLQPEGSAGAGNSLVAYDVAAAGGRRWSLPAAGAEPAGTWFLGPPLAVDGDLYVLVEEKGEARLDVIDAATGTVTWTQPLAEIDEPLAVDHAGARGRRLAGLTPAVADGVLVCPLGVGTVMAVDLATRTLRWAFHYAIPADDGGADAGPTPFGPKTAGLPGLPRDSIPVIAAGRVLLTPRDCDDLVCLDLRSGSPAWADPPGGGLNVAGVVDDTVVVVGRNAVAALALADGSRRWELPWERVGGRPSGRGLLTPTSLLLPVDGPAVVEIGIADGGIRGRSVARGGAVPGNLVAHRGAVISRGLGTLDVFHQTASLQARLEAVEAEESESAWAAHWRGQLDLDRGHIAAGLALLKTAASSGGFGGGPETLSEAVIVGMRCDFATAAPAWRDVWQVEARRPGGPSSGARAVLRAAVDGFLQSGDLAAAWEPARELLAVDEPLIGDPPVPDPIDEALAVTEDRWLGGRLAELAIRGPEPLRHQIDAAVAAALARTVDGDGDVRLERLERLVGRLGNHPAAATVRQALLDEFDARLAAGRDTGAAARLSLRRDVLRLAFPASAAEPPAADDDWPLGRVTIDRSQATLPTEPEPGRSRRLPLAFTADRPFLPGIGLAHDLQHGCLLVLDGYGRRIAEPLAIDAGQLRLDLGWPPQSAGVEASCLGRMLFVRSGGAVSAYDLAADCGGRNLWTRSDGSAATRDPAGGWIRPLDGDAPEVGGLPLGLSMDAAEPAAVRVRGGGARISGVLHHDRRSLALLDPFSGCVAWERHGLPPASELVCDDDFVTICGRDGEESLVFSMQDGRLVRTLRLPPSRQRLGTFGRWIVATVPAADAVEDGAVGLRLEMIDPATAERQSLGDTAADSRAVLTGDRLLVIDRDGLLTAYDLARRRAAFEVRLPEVPQRVDFLQAIPWHDRLLVVAGSQGGDPAAAGAGSRRGSAGGGDRPAVDAAVWALDRSTGDPAWPVPATVAGMSLSAGQPPLVPTLVFHRHVARGGERQRLDLLALDKRTGHAVLAERGLVVHAGFTGAAVQGDPEAHAISVREAETGSRGFLVTYTGVPQPPQRPFQADREPGPHLGRFEGPLGPLPGNGRHPGTPMRRRP
jgi:outer membrane protein assembly factor BamB